MRNIYCVKKTLCTGCGACKSICPKNAIIMMPDTYGFMYPYVDLSKCIKCDKCVKHCPAINTYKITNQKYECKAAMANNNIRKESSSGGVFSILAEYILGNNGVVVGAAFESKTIVKHIIIDKVDDIKKLRGSKYVQSDLTDIFQKTKNLLDTQKKVLFSGTPCQVYGLYSFLGKNYSNLYTIDIMCHGVSSQGILNKYLSENFTNEKVKYISFRNKTNGWNYELTLMVITDKKTYNIPYQESSYYYLFLNAISLRESCYNCKYASLPRVGDITLGDFWEIKSYNQEFDDNFGTSLVILNNKKGIDLYRNIIGKLKLNESVPIEVAKKGNNTLMHPTLKNHLNKQFRNEYTKETLNNNLKNLKEYKFDFAIYNFWWTINYGATLTAYALQKLLTLYGKTSTLISYLYDRDPNKVFYNKISEKFAREHLTYTKIYSSEKELVDLNNITNKFIVGSDQVFRDDYFKDSCFLNFVNYDKIKIAFSASFGTDTFNISPKRIDKYKFLLSRFDYISVRELSGIEICKSTFNIKAKQILDPVFLVDKNVWDVLVKESNLKTNNKYILSYILDNNLCLNRKISDYAKDNNFDVIKIDSNTHSIQDWLYLIKHADFVVTDSFHGLCFSIIFNKKINCLININRGKERFISLQKLLHISRDVFFYDSSTYKIKNIENLMVNYNEINDLLQKLKDFGVGELNKIINLKKEKIKKNEEIDKALLKKFYRKKFKLTFFIKKYTYFLLFLLLNKDKIYKKYLKYKNKSRL